MIFGKLFIKVLLKMRFSEIVKMRQTCSQINSFIEHHRTEISASSCDKFYMDIVVDDANFSTEISNNFSSARITKSWLSDNLSGVRIDDITIWFRRRGKLKRSNYRKLLKQLKSLKLTCRILDFYCAKLTEADTFDLAAQISTKYIRVSFAEKFSFKRLFSHKIAQKVPNLSFYATGDDRYKQEWKHFPMKGLLSIIRQKKSVHFSFHYDQESFAASALQSLINDIFLPSAGLGNLKRISFGWFALVDPNPLIPTACFIGGKCGLLSNSINRDDVRIYVMPLETKLLVLVSDEERKTQNGRVYQRISLFFLEKDFELIKGVMKELTDELPSEEEFQHICEIIGNGNNWPL